jgi:hypothetical protein
LQRGRGPRVERVAPDLQLLAVPLLQARAAVMHGRQLCDDAATRGRWRHRSRRFYNKGETAVARRCCDRRLVLLPSISGDAASGGRRCYHRPPALLQAAAGGATFRQRRPPELFSISGVAASGASRSCNRWPAELLSVSGGATGPSGFAASGVWYRPSRVLLPPAPGVAASGVRRCYPSISGGATGGAASKFSRSCKRSSSMLLSAVARAASGSPGCCKGSDDGWRLRRRDMF